MSSTEFVKQLIYNTLQKGTDGEIEARILTNFTKEMPQVSKTMFYRLVKTVNCKDSHFKETHDYFIKDSPIRITKNMDGTIIEMCNKNRLGAHVDQWNKSHRYGVRFCGRHELGIKEEEKEEMKDWESEVVSVRIKNRASFNQGNFQLDLTISRMGSTLEEAEDAPPKYEVELEYVGEYDVKHTDVVLEKIRTMSVQMIDIMSRSD